MSRIVDTMTKEVVSDILKLLEKKAWPELPIDLDPPIGDFAIICFPAAKTLKKEPSKIAEELARELEGLDSVASTSVEKGYCNINLKSFLTITLRTKMISLAFLIVAFYALLRRLTFSIFRNVFHLFFSIFPGTRS